MKAKPRKVADVTGRYLLCILVHWEK
jgi:hypothetical protein